MPFKNCNQNEDYAQRSDNSLDKSPESMNDSSYNSERRSFGNGITTTISNLVLSPLRSFLTSMWQSVSSQRLSSFIQWVSIFFRNNINEPPSDQYISVSDSATESATESESESMNRQQSSVSNQNTFRNRMMSYDLRPRPQWIPTVLSPETIDHTLADRQVFYQVTTTSSYFCQPYAPDREEDERVLLAQCTNDMERFISDDDEFNDSGSSTGSLNRIEKH